MHHMGINKAHRKSLMGVTQKCYELCFEQILEVTATAQPPASNPPNYSSMTARHARHSLKSKDELISDVVLLWTPTFGHTSVN